MCTFYLMRSAKMDTGHSAWIMCRHIHTYRHGRHSVDHVVATPGGSVAADAGTGAPGAGLPGAAC